MNNQPNSEKNPLDELFARRLGKLERAPSADSFARLQQRMQGGQAQPRFIVWRTPAVQMAAAACVAAVLLAGWFYDSRSADTLSDKGASVAMRESTGKSVRTQTSESLSNRPTGNERTTPQMNGDNGLRPDRPGINTPAAISVKDLRQTDEATKPRLAHAQPEKRRERPATRLVEPGNESVAAPAPQLAVNVPAVSATPKPVAERVLVVTIEEPEALVAARQTAASVVNNMPVLAASPSKEGKATFWQQVKRLRQEDDVARQDAKTDESGLLSRAYKGIRQRLEKDKPAKQ